MSWTFKKIKRTYSDNLTNKQRKKKSKFLVQLDGSVWKQKLFPSLLCLRYRFRCKWNFVKSNDVKFHYFVFKKNLWKWPKSCMKLLWPNDTFFFKTTFLYLTFKYIVVCFYGLWMCEHVLYLPFDYTYIYIPIQADRNSFGISFLAFFFFGRI